MALDYIALVEAGAVKDRSHTKTVADAFGVHRTTVQAWCRDPDLAASGMLTPDQALARVHTAGASRLAQNFRRAQATAACLTLIAPNVKSAPLLPRLFLRQP